MGYIIGDRYAVTRAFRAILLHAVEETCMKLDVDLQRFEQGAGGGPPGGMRGNASVTTSVWGTVGTVSVSISERTGEDAHLTISLLITICARYGEVFVQDDTLLRITEPPNRENLSRLFHGIDQTIDRLSRTVSDEWLFVGRQQDAARAGS